jgi:hypothetical protein
MILEFIFLISNEEIGAKWMSPLPHFGQDEKNTDAGERSIQ